MTYETVIGLEIHVQLATRTKLFCADAYEYGARANTRVCPVCLGLPGALPVANTAAVELAVRAALGLGCTVHETSVFARKSYFYPDLPKGYQITQYDRPLATGGALEVPAGGERGEGEPPLNSISNSNSNSNSKSIPSSDPGPPIRIRRVHLEEDSGKSRHELFEGRTALDFNRAGVPLVEIVTEPDLRSPEQARAFLTRLKRVLEYLAVSDCDMEKGSLRVDANVSARPVGTHALGTKTEIKNLNSFGNVERALRYEAERQRARLEAGEPVVHETRLWDPDAGEARPLRSKEESHDYRYFPEPDLPPLVLDPAAIDQARRDLPELPNARAARFREHYGLPDYDAAVLTASRDLADYFETTAEAAGDAKAASNRIMTDVLAWLNEHGEQIGAFPVPPERLGELIGLVREGTISSSMGSTVLGRMIDSGRSAAAIVEAEGLAQVSDDAQLERWVDEALAAHPDEAARLRGGEAKLIGFFMGEVMQRSGGTADPERASELLRSRPRDGQGTAAE